MLSDRLEIVYGWYAFVGLNAPYGARCFLTSIVNTWYGYQQVCLNAPYGARCFLTNSQEWPEVERFIPS